MVDRPFPLKPPVRVRRGALVRRVERSVLAPRAEEELFRSAEVLGEGKAQDDGYYGSTLVTIDLTKLGITDVEASERLFAAVERSVRVRLRAMRLAQADAARRVPDRLFGTASVETRIRLDGLKLLLDVDLEIPFVQGSERSSEVG